MTQMTFFAPFKAGPGSKHHDWGFTLLEALVVMSLLGLLAGLAAPTLTGLRAQHQLQGQAESFLDSLVLARSEALRRQQRITLCPRSTAQACDALGRWQQGWLVFVDDNNNGLREPGELLLEVREALAKNVQVGVTSTVKTYYSYNAEGRSATANGAFMAGTWRFCLSPSPRAWRVVGNALGKPRIEEYAAQQCP